jgi:hypothetical protein
MCANSYIICDKTSEFYVNARNVNAVNRCDSMWRWTKCEKSPTEWSWNWVKWVTDCMWIEFEKFKIIKHFFSGGDKKGVKNRSKKM